MTIAEFADAISESSLKQGRCKVARELADWLEKETDGMRLHSVSTDRLLDFLKGLTK